MATREGRPKAFGDCLKKLKQKRLQKKLEELRRQIAQAERLGDGQRVDEYARQYRTLLRQTS